MPGPHLFIDGRNCAYRAIYANQSGNNHDLIVMLRLMRSWLDKHEPQAVHVFWDAPRHTVWRRQILPEYKDRSNHKRSVNFDIADSLEKLQAAAHDLFAAMAVRQYRRKQQEADDLIYAACRHVFPDNVIIVSSDNDFDQIQYFMHNVRIWDPGISNWQQQPVRNPVICKALMGDSTDRITGYYGIGEVKSAQLTESPQKLHDFLNSVDRKIFLRNMLLIDLGLCPFLLANQMYIAKQMQSPLSFDKMAIMAAISKHKIVGAIAEYSKLIMPFKQLISDHGSNATTLPVPIEDN